MSELVVGIDLGTSNSVISVVLEGEPIVIPDADGNRVHPSMVYFREDGRTVLGNRARQHRVEDPAHTIYSAKRLIGRSFSDPDVKLLRGSFPFPIVEAADGSPRFHLYDQLHPPEGISGRMLHYLRGVAQEYLGQPVTKAVITVPANFDEGQRRATKRAASLGGFEVLRLINEPTAAALAYGHGEQKRERVAIYDLGGGTFDITILQLRNDIFEVLSTAGDSYLGGDDIDNRLVQAMLNAFEKQYGYDLSGEMAVRQRLKVVAEQVKHNLSSRDSVSVQVTEYAPGSLHELVLDFSLSREAFDRRAADVVDQSIRTCEDALRVAGLQRAEIDHLVLVGGSTRIPLVQQRVQQFFGRRPVLDINPDEVVSIGAAILGASLVEVQQAPEPSSWPVMGGATMDTEGNLSSNAPPVPPSSRPRTSTQPGNKPAAVVEIDNDDSWLESLEAQQQARPSRGPVLIDVIPHALGVETVGGVMDIIVERNASLPLERTRYFSTSRDDQTRVVLPIFSGNSRRIEDNRQLGQLELTEIPPGPREEVSIEVTFEIDTDGMLNVRATDLRTGTQQFVRLSITGDGGGSGDAYDASELLM
ncbi:Hsp70 family protein [Bradymonas sediminis]|uniref:Molecular chaperone DnaK n=1 Tax=Bradymonas sediminis TaxID=1548548 RepID=A0A2Z4FQG3_9DELT|nr:Hsp70 family protein [Bradymonas sediminis]AWV91193.1 molecular chaperone DnaK [Bradymonas sediminis]TDP73757.1 Hsp70 protein [Bradymonas sediminis]